MLITFMKDVDNVEGISNRYREVKAILKIKDKNHHTSFV